MCIAVWIVFTLYFIIHSRGNIYYCFAVLNSCNLDLFDIHEMANFIGVMLQLILYFTDVNVLVISKVGIHFYTLLILTFTLFPGTSVIYKLLIVYTMSREKVQWSYL